MSLPSGNDFTCLINVGSQCLFGINATCSTQFSPNGVGKTEVCN